MKSSIRSFVLTAFAAATILATAHSASAQNIFSSNASGDHQFGGGGTASVMVLALPYAGTYMIGGQQAFANTGNNPSQVVSCWVSTVNGSTTGIPFGPQSWATVGGLITLPLNGSYTATGPTDLWVVCHNYGAAGSVALATWGNITAVYE